MSLEVTFAMRQVTDALSRIRRDAAVTEADLHQAVSVALTALGLAYTHEARLSPGCRIDILCQNGVGIEIKKGLPSARNLRAQVTRYMESSLICGVVVVTERSVRLPERLLDKPVQNIALARLWGVALH